MEFTTASKVALGTLLLGVAGYFGKEYILGYSIADLIKQHNPERKLILSTKSLYSDKWKRAWNEYLEDNKNRNKDAWGLPDWDVKLVSSKNNESVPTSFIDACDSFSQTNVISTSSQLYKEVLKWCTSASAEKISELIKERGRRVLKSDSKDKVGSEWREALTKYLSVQGNPLGISGIEKDLKQEQLTTGTPAFDDFVKKCQALTEKSEGVTEDDISRVVAHCSAERTIKDLIIEERPDRGFIDVKQIKPNSPIGIELWSKYFNSNKDKEQDDWSVGQWVEKKKQTPQVAPEHFFKNCNDKSSKVALGMQPKLINELVRYCTYDAKVGAIYTEPSSVARS